MVQRDNGSSCVRPEKVSIVWAVIHICLASLSSIFYLHALLTLRFAGVSTRLALYEPTPTIYANMVLRLTSSLIDVMFAAFLYYGVDKKKSSYVKAYFIYGVLNVVLAVMTTLGYSIYEYVVLNRSVDFIILGIVAVFCVIYSLVLVMVRRTYQIFKAVKDQCDNKLLEAQNFIIS